jgi:hypothetical protein
MLLRKSGESRADCVQKCLQEINIMYEYFVICNGQKKVICIEEKENLVGEIRKKFNVENETGVKLSVYNEKWGEYVDQDDGDDLPDSCKIAATLVYQNNWTER